ncbi:MAG: MFS transporter [Planctomycetes bacterium]|nr:MFS transporter [Planctomycetota bacterium]
MQDAAAAPSAAERKLFWACFVAMVSTSFAFILRIMVMDDLAQAFNLSDTQRGEILGVGIWPFGVSIVLFSLVIDRIGYSKAILFAFLAHTAFVILTVTASSYWMLYAGSALGGLAAGAIEAAINPLVATVFRQEKTKWLNILHAGWPAGLVLAGMLAIALGEGGVLAGLSEGGIGWQVRIALVMVPVVLYGVLMATCRFPVSERVAAGVPYREMLKIVGVAGAAITTTLIMLEVGRALDASDGVLWVSIAALTLAFGVYARSFGRPLFLLLMLTMIPLAITELGTDSWISGLMEPELKALGAHPTWVLIYTAALMMVLRFFAGPIVHRLSPLGLLATSSALAMLGLFALSSVAGAAVFLAATVYGLGKTFFWPTMLGVVSEQFPRGGALTLNLMGGIGMLAAGVLGNPLLGNIQDREIERILRAEHTAIHSQIIGEEKRGLFGTYRAIDQYKLAAAGPEVKRTTDAVQGAAKKSALRTVLLFPGLMLVSYLGMILYFRARGGYRPVQI